MPGVAQIAVVEGVGWRRRRVGRIPAPSPRHRIWPLALASTRCGELPRRPPFEGISTSLALGGRHDDGPGGMALRSKANSPRRMVPLSVLPAKKCWPAPLLIARRLDL